MIPDSNTEMNLRAAITKPALQAQPPPGGFVKKALTFYVGAALV
jgi:hypothetical protein